MTGHCKTPFEQDVIAIVACGFYVADC